MICGVGLDIVSVERIEKALEKNGEAFRKRVFTEGEVEDSRAGGREPESLSGRFAAKEAAMKALGTGWAEGVGWHDLEVRSGNGGKPELFLHGRAAEVAISMGANKTHLSISHDNKMASAVVILERLEDSPR